MIREEYTNPSYINETNKSFKASKQSSPKKQSIKVSSNTMKNKQIELDKEEDTRKHKLVENRLKFLHSRLGAVMKGYKTRRIYHNNKIIRKYRIEFREIIQFAYNLKKDIEEQRGT